MKVRHPLIATALAVVLAAPAFAQQQTAPDTTAPMNSQQTSPMAKSADHALNQTGFVQSQSASEWRGSKLIGATVYGTENESIGEINDVLVGEDGNIRAAIIGVGGFLGIGEKNVAVPFEALNVQRKPDSNAIDKIMVRYTKDQLKNAPKFTYYEGSMTQTTGSGSNQPAGAVPMTKPKK